MDLRRTDGRRTDRLTAGWPENPIAISNMFLAKLPTSFCNLLVCMPAADEQICLDQCKVVLHILLSAQVSLYDTYCLGDVYVLSCFGTLHGVAVYLGHSLLSTEKFSFMKTTYHEILFN